MSEAPDTRWKQRFENFSKALACLRDAVVLAGKRNLSNLEKQGLIQAFEFTHELAWNVLKDYLEDQGVQGIIGSKNASREAFRNGLLEDGQAWMDMIKARNLTSHTYNTGVAEAMVQEILTRYFAAFLAMETQFQGLATREEDRS